jgi:phage shock protein PspC (stress-responsive transcriptional regulator)
MVKKWTRDKNGMLGGVLGGLGKYLDVDPTILRIIFVLLWLSPTVISTVIFYFVFWVLLPEEEEETTK